VQSRLVKSEGSEQGYKKEVTKKQKPTNGRFFLRLRLGTAAEIYFCAVKRQRKIEPPKAPPLGVLRKQ
jgi:hypothetical protein